MYGDACGRQTHTYVTFSRCLPPAGGGFSDIGAMLVAAHIMALHETEWVPEAVMTRRCRPEEPEPSASAAAA